MEKENIYLEYQVFGPGNVVFSGYMPRSGIAGSYDSSIFSLVLFFFFFLLFSIVAVSIYISTNSVRGFPFTINSIYFL